MRCFYIQKLKLFMLKRKIYLVAMGLALAHLSIANISRDCAECTPASVVEFPKPLLRQDQDFLKTINDSLAKRPTGFTHGAGLIDLGQDMDKRISTSAMLRPTELNVGGLNLTDLRNNMIQQAGSADAAAVAAAEAAKKAPLVAPSFAWSRLPLSGFDSFQVRHPTNGFETNLGDYYRYRVKQYNSAMTGVGAGYPSIPFHPNVYWSSMPGSFFTGY